MEYIESLRLFRTIVEVKNFRRAGEMLDLSPSVVSRAIASLEERLGARLFHRSTRQFSLTEAAERFYDGCCRILDDLDCLEANAASHGRLPAGVLRLVAHTTATLTWLAPLILSFKRKHPKITLDLTLTERPVDLTADGYDLGIILPFMLATDLAVTRLLQRLPLVIVTTEAYLNRRPRPRHPADLADHVFVTVPPSMHKPFVTFRMAQENVAFPINYEITSNNPIFNRDVLLEGFGVGVLPITLVEHDIKAGRLVRLLEQFEIADTAAEVRLAYIGRALLPAKVRAFIDHAAEFFEGAAEASDATR
ncbi:LysR family transcriptional regulator [Paraburkholderia terrae]|uniref:LysR family transcriptional regulator n=1 Tax=Paraburkholderia terrae TaxID=311230 RepID=A0A2I8F5U4_9BURK|nr:LysR family transcriptional regulator [Paraburkholderia terrae]AUT66434.1 LysR family transcriptional regulator [Paraburkholderia terrae]